MVGVSSQCVTRIVGLFAKTRRKASASSTSIFPVEAPIKSFTPAMFRVSNCDRASALSNVAPKKKP